MDAKSNETHRSNLNNEGNYKADMRTTISPLTLRACTENTVINGEKKSKCARWFKQAVMGCEIKMLSSREVIF